MIKFHPSRLGLIMSEAKSVDPALLVGDLEKLYYKTKKTDEEKAILAPLWDKTLSSGAKTELKNIAKEVIFNYEKRITTKFMEKGLACEQPCIDLYNSVFFRNLKKNTERRENEWLTGEIDLCDDDEIIDIKCAWDLSTFPAFSEDIVDSLYQWQLRGYLMLWEKPRAKVAYCLVDTPEELIKWEQQELHRVSHIPPIHRISTYQYERDLALEEKIKVKCTAAQEYIKQLFAQFEREHQL